MNLWWWNLRQESCVGSWLRVRGGRARLGEGSRPAEINPAATASLAQHQPGELNPRPHRPWLITGRMSRSERTPLNGA